MPSDGPDLILLERELETRRGQRGRDWHRECQRSDGGSIVNNLANTALALRSDPRWRGVLSFDEMAMATLIDGRIATDASVAVVHEQLQLAGLKRVSKDVVHEGIDLVARENSFHPVRQYLDRLCWDNRPRLNQWPTSYLGADLNEYTSGVGRMFLLAMIARVYQPGCKSDHTLVIEAGQGAGKSSACRILGGDWFSDALPADVSSKDASQHLRGHWLIEIAELQSMNRSEVNALKSFLTRDVERFRPPYGRKEVHEPRQCVFVGTTNKMAYLKDETGGRRFWPIRCGQIDLDALAHDRDQLFAEAVSAYRASEPWWPDQAFERMRIAPEQGERFDPDVWEERISEYLLPNRRVTVGEIAEHALHFRPSSIGRADQNRITAVLERLGARRLRRTGKGQHWTMCEGVKE